MGSGYTVDTTSLAIRIGELRSLAAAVESTAGALSTTCGRLGPGDLTAAVEEVAQRWRDGLGKMREKIDTMADNVDNAVANYTTIEQGGQARMDALADRTVAETQLNTLRGAAAALLTQRDDLLNQAGGKQP